MTLGTGDMVTLVKSNRGLYSFTLDMNNRRAYWLEWKRNFIFWSDYDGKNKTRIEIRRILHGFILDVSERSIFLMQNDQTRILMLNKTEEDVFRSFMIEKSGYYKLIVFNKVNRTMGK